MPYSSYPRRQLASSIIVEAIVRAIRINLDANRHPRGGNRDRLNSGGPAAAAAKVDELLTGSNRRFLEIFRVTIDEFKDLMTWLRANTDIEGSRYQSDEMKTLIFLYIICNAATQRQTAHFFGVSQSSVSRTVASLIRCFVRLYKAFVRLPPEDFVSPEVELDRRSRHFNGCIGAIDGTQIAAHICRGPAYQRWRNRKQRIAQNVFVAMKLDGSFSYVLAGAEGSMNDSKLLHRVLHRHTFRIPRGRYYLSDAGFGLTRGVITPFSQVRYHLSDWQGSGRRSRPRNAKEIYNLWHCRLRVIVEQGIGWLRRRCRLIRDTAPEYSLSKQINFVYCCAGLYNFIHFLRKSKVRYTAQQRQIIKRARVRADRDIPGVDIRELRRRVAVKCWRSYNIYMRRN